MLDHFSLALTFLLHISAQFCDHVTMWCRLLKETCTSYTGLHAKRVFTWLWKCILLQKKSLCLQINHCKCSSGKTKTVLLYSYNAIPITFVTIKWIILMSSAQCNRWSLNVCFQLEDMLGSVFTSFPKANIYKMICPRSGESVTH